MIMVKRWHIRSYNPNISSFNVTQDGNELLEACFNLVEILQTYVCEGRHISQKR